MFELGLLAPKDPKAEHISNSDCVRHFKCIIMKKGCNVSQLDRRRELMTKPCPLAAIRRPNSVALLVPPRSVQFSSVQDQWLRFALASFCLPLMWLARVVHLTRVEATVFGVGMDIGCDDCNDDVRTSPESAIAMERGEASAVRMSARKIKQKLSN